MWKRTKDPNLNPLTGIITIFNIGFPLLKPNFADFGSEFYRMIIAIKNNYNKFVIIIKLPLLMFHEFRSIPGTIWVLNDVFKRNDDFRGMIMNFVSLFNYFINVKKPLQVYFN